MTNASSSKPMLAALGGARVMPPPIWFMRQAGRYLPEYRQLRAEADGFLDLVLSPRRAAEVTLQPIRRFGMDGAILFSDILMVPYGLGQPLAFVEGEGPRLEPLRTEEALAALEPSQVMARLAPIIETVARVKANLPPACTLIGFAGAPWTVAAYMIEGRGSHNFMEARAVAARHPAMVQRLIDCITEATLAYLSAQIEAGAEVIQLFESHAGVLTAAARRNLVIRPTKALVQRLRIMHPRVPIIGFPRGIGAQLEHYATETGVDAVGLDETVAPAFAAERLQVGLGRPVQGNLDPVALLVGGAELERDIRQIVADLGRGPFVFNLGHGVMPQTPPDHVAQAIELVRSLGRAGGALA